MSGIPGTVVSFYSYKGGVGRTMALGNVAITLAQNGFRVLVVDLDLYAPGVQEYPPFQKAVESSIRYLLPGDRELGHGGMLDLIERQLWSSAPPEEQPFREKLRPVDAKKEIWQKWMRRVHEHKASGGYVDVIPAGPADHRALETLSGIGWYGFLTKFDGFEFFLSMRDQWWRGDYDFTLIDSRTGLSDYLQFCVGILPDVAVVVAGLNEENLKGLDVPLASINEVLPSRKSGLRIIPVLSLIPSGDLDKSMDRIRKAEESLRSGEWAGLILGAPVRLPYVATLAVEELLVVPEHPHASVFREYVRIAERLARHRFEEIDNLINLALYEGAVTGLTGGAVTILDRARDASEKAQYTFGIIRCAKLDAQRSAYSKAVSVETQKRFQAAVALIRKRHNLKPGQRWKDAHSSVGHWQIELETLVFYARVLAGEKQSKSAVRAFNDALEFMNALEKRNHADMFADRDWDRYAHELLFTRAFCQWGLLQVQAAEIGKGVVVKSVLQASVDKTYELLHQLMPTGISSEVAEPLKQIADDVKRLP
jgi:hypothetical protein